MQCMNINGKLNVIVCVLRRFSFHFCSYNLGRGKTKKNLDTNTCVHLFHPLNRLQLLTQLKYGKIHSEKNKTKKILFWGEN